MNKSILVLLLAQWGFAFPVFAQEGAPQEAPYIQEEDEFDAITNDKVPPASEETDALNLENELGKPSSDKPSVNLNETSDKKLEEELMIEENHKVAVPEAETPPLEEPVIEVRPASKVPRTRKTTKSAKGGVEYIQHPQAKKGLMLITKEGAYVYKTEESEPYKKSGSFRFGTMDSPKITAADGSTTFSQMYSSGQVPVLSFDFDWQPFQSFGKLGLQAGFGLIYTSGNGRFADGSGQAEEKYTFLAVPLNLGLSYRLEVWDRQWVAPYVAGGGTYVGVAEFRDDGKSPSLVGTPGAYGAGGLMFNISAMNRETSYTLRTEYGIQNLWVSVDFRYLATFSEDLDFSSSIIGGGITCDY